MKNKKERKKRGEIKGRELWDDLHVERGGRLKGGSAALRSAVSPEVVNINAVIEIELDNSESAG